MKILAIAMLVFVLSSCAIDSHAKTTSQKDITTQEDVSSIQSRRIENLENLVRSDADVLDKVNAVSDIINSSKRKFTKCRAFYDYEG